MLNRLRRKPHPQPRLSIPEVREKITEQKNEHKEVDAVCPITLLTPFFAVQPGDPRRQENYDGFSLLRHIDGYGTSPWNPEEKVTLKTVASKYKSNQTLMTAFNQALEQEGYTLHELLAYYKISPELFRYLIDLDFHSAFEEAATTGLDKIKTLIADNSFRITLFIAAASFLLYRKMILSEICLSNLAINQSAYDLIYGKIMEVHEMSPNNTFGPAYCENMGYANVSNMKMHGFDGSMLGLGKNGTYFEIITAQMEKVNTFMASRILLLMLYTSSYFFVEMLRWNADDETRLSFNAFLFFIAILSMNKAFDMRDYYDNLLSLLSHSTQINSIARACNDGFLRLRLTNQTVPPELSPALELPACTKSWLNLTTASYSLLAGPVSFFGARVARACWKKFNPPPPLPVEEQFNALRKKKFTV